MLTISFEQYARQFVSISGDVEERLKLATEIRDNIEIVHTPEYANFLKYLFPVFYNILRQGQAQVGDAGPQHKLRNVILEILSRLPNNEQLKSVVSNLLKLAMYLLEMENEENALICLRIVIDLHKNYRPDLANDVQPFLDIVQKIYSELPNTVALHFSASNKPSAAAGTTGPFGAVGAEGTKPGSFIRSLQSFKVLTECPIIVVLLFQLYPKFLQANIPKFMPLIVKALSLQAPPNAYQNHRAAYVDFIACQVKTLSFLAYLLRGFAEHLRPYQENIPKYAIQLLTNCPNESASIRKELMIATRHILATDFRNGFINEIDTLLDEKVLIGTGRTSHETLRPLAYSTLVDLVHHVRADLTLQQLSRVVHLYSCNIHDPTLPFGIQTMSAKILLNLVECIVRKNSESNGRGRPVLVHILDAFVNKFSSLKHSIPGLLEASKQKDEDEKDAGANWQSERSNDQVKDCRLLLKTLVLGLKNIVWGISSCNSKFNTVSSSGPSAASVAAAAGPTSADYAAALATAGRPETLGDSLSRNKDATTSRSARISVEESLLFTRLLRNGLMCFSIYGTGQRPTAEEKENLDSFAQVFTMVDPRIFQDVFTTQLPFLFDQILVNQSMLLIPQHFLANQGISKIFAEILLESLMERMSDLSGSSKVVAAVLARLFKLVFNSVTVFQENESVLQPRLISIINCCVRYATEVKESVNFFGLLRSLFRSIGGGKFDRLYREFLPRLPDLLEWMNRLQDSAHPRSMKYVFAELCFTVPVRLTALIPYLGLLMKPLIVALNSTNGELITQGLRMLELLIDNLYPDYLNPVLAHYKADIMLSIWRHLKPLPAPHGAQAVRVLGKLAGRNRVLIKGDPSSLYPELSYNKKPAPALSTTALSPWSWSGVNATDTILADDGAHMRLSFQPYAQGIYPMGRSIYLAHKQLLEGVVPYKKQAFEFLKVCLMSKLDVNLGDTQSLKGRYTKEDLCQPVDPLPESTVGCNYSPVKLTPQLAEIDHDLMKLLIKSVFIAMSCEPLKEGVAAFCTDVTTHFAFLLSKETCEAEPVLPGSLVHISPLVFMDALACAMTTDNCSFAPLCKTVLSQFVEDVAAITGSLEAAQELPCFDHLSELLCDACYLREWYAMRGASSGIGHLLSLMPLSWTMKHHIKFLKALRHVLEDMLPELSLDTLTEAREVFDKLINQVVDHAVEVNQTALVSKGLTEFGVTVTEICSGLCHSSTEVRAAAKAAVAMVSEKTGIPLKELLKQCFGTLEERILGVRLNTLSTENQIGAIDCMCYLLEADHTLFTNTAELVVALKDVLAIAESEELSVGTSSASSSASTSTTTPSSALTQLWYYQKKKVTALHASAVRALSAAMACEFGGPELKEFRDRIVGVFFKTLTFRSEEVVEAAKNGLARVNEQQQLAKDLLQTSLRPVLLNLADHRKLTVPLLKGLSRLLELLANCFNITLGEKLLEHLAKWKDPTKTQSWSTKESTEIAAEIIDIFHRLPSAAEKFLEKLVTLTIGLESMLPGEASSPYRIPLTRFLNRYSAAAVSFFLERIGQKPFCTLFQFVLREESAGPLREELHLQSSKLISATFSRAATNPELSFEGVVIVKTLVHFQPDWQMKNPTVHQQMLALWDSPERQARLTSENMLAPLFYLRESKLLVKCFLNYCKWVPTDIDMLFKLLPIFCARTTLDFSFVKDFLTNDVANNYRIELKRAILHAFLRFYSDPAPSKSAKVQALQVLVTPLLTASFTKGDAAELLGGDNEKELVQAIMANILEDSMAAEGSPVGPEDEALSIELLRLATLLVQYIPVRVGEHKKKLIKFAWNHLKSEDATSRQCAYVLVCRFIEAYETPAKIVLQVFVALLRCHQPEARQLVRKALDILTPALTSRLPVGDPRFPTWIRWTRKIMIEEGHTLPQLIHILQLLVRHPNEFYPCRGQFIHTIVTSLGRIGLLPNSPFENRKLAVDLVDLVVNWEKKRLAGGASSSGGDTVMKEATETVVADDYRPPLNIVEIMVNFLVRVASTQTSSQDAGSLLAKRAMELLRESFGLWPAVPIKLDFFAKIVAPVADQPQLVCTGLQILLVVLEYQADMLVPKYIPQLQTIITPALTSDNLKIVGSLCVLLKKIITSYPPQKTPEAMAFYSKIGQTIESGLLGNDKGKFYSTVIILKTLCTEVPETLDRYIPGLVKLIQKLAKDHCSPSKAPAPAATEAADANASSSATDSASSSSSTAARGGRGNTSTAAAAAASTRADVTSAAADTSNSIKLCIKLITTRSAHLGENKRPFFATLALLIEKSKDVELLDCITKTIKGWILGVDSNGNPLASAPVITSKEKITFLLKMTKFEQVNDINLQTTFLNLVYHIYCDASASKTEVSQLEPGFMMGLRFKDSEIRSKFFKIFHLSIAKSLSARLHYIFCVQNWESLGSSFWIRQALELVLAVAVMEEPLSKPENSPTVAAITSPMDAMSDGSSAMDTSSPELDVILERHTRFLGAVKQLKTKDVVKPLMELLHQSTELAFQLWLTMFPRLWCNMSNVDQHKLTGPLVHLLAKEYHNKQQHSKPNVIQALLQGIAQVYTTKYVINVDPRITKFLGKSYNAWHTSIFLIEKQWMLGLFADELPENHYGCLSELYSLLQEDDLYFALWLNHPGLKPATKTALQLQQFGRWHKAQESLQSVLSSTPGPALLEKALCEQHWVSCASQLNTWDIITEYGKAIGHHELIFSSAWKCSEWGTMKEHMNKHNVHPANPTHRLYQCYMAIQEGKPQDVEAHASQAVQALLLRWQALPKVPGPAHIPLLQLSQRLIEVQESAQVVFDITASNRHQSISEVKSVLSTWRDRLPNPWESTIIWGDILAWRQYIFTQINNAYQPLVKVNTALAYIGHHETAWSINKFAHVARTQLLIELCLSSLSKIYTLPNIEIQDAFVKLREQVKCYFQVPSHYKNGLDIINSTNLDYFAPRQKAEFFKLKGQFLSKMNISDEANAALSTAVAIYDGTAGGWVAWGEFCDRQFFNESKGKWAECAVTCFLQAAKNRSSKAHRKLARVLWLLFFYNEQCDLGAVFKKGAEALPPWLWIPYIGEMLQRRDTPEGAVFRPLLEKIALEYPQAMFTRLRTILDMESNVAVGQSSSARASSRRSVAASAEDTKTASAYASTLMAGLMERHKELSSSLELCFSEIEQNLRPVPLQAAKMVITAVQMACHDQAGTSSLSLAIAKLLAFDESLLEPSHERQAVLFDTVPIKEAFERDFGSFSQPLTGAAGASQLEKLKGMAQKWSARLEVLVWAGPKSYHLKDISPQLLAVQNRLANHKMEVPGQYSSNWKEPTPEQHSTISRFEPVVDVQSTEGLVNARLRVTASNGVVHEFFVSHSINKVRKERDAKLTAGVAPDGAFLAEERLSSLFRHFNNAFQKHKETRRRGLRLASPTVVPLSSTVRLIESQAGTSLAQLWRDYCSSQQLDASLPMRVHAAALLAGSSPLEALQAAQDAAGPSPLAKFAYAAMPSFRHLFHFKQSLAAQLALLSFASHSFCVVGMSSSRLLLSLHSGGAWATGFHPNYNATGVVSNTDAVPFRLTPGMVDFISPLGLTLFATSMTAAAIATSDEKDNLMDHIHLFLQDDLLGWQAAGELESAFSNNLQLKGRVKANVQYVVAHVDAISTPITAEKLSTPQNEAVQRLIEAATSTDNLSKMSPSWQAWL